MFREVTGAATELGENPVMTPDKMFFLVCLLMQQCRSVDLTLVAEKLLQRQNIPCSMGAKGTMLVFLFFFPFAFGHRAD